MSDEQRTPTVWEYDEVKRRMRYEGTTYDESTGYDDDNGRWAVAAFETVRREREAAGGSLNDPDDTFQPERRSSGDG